MRAVSLLVALGLGLLACFNAPDAAVQFSCDPDAASICPDGYTCEADGCCHRNGSDVTQSFGACQLSATDSFGIPGTDTEPMTGPGTDAMTGTDTDPLTGTDTDTGSMSATDSTSSTETSPPASSSGTTGPTGTDSTAGGVI